MSYKTEVDEKYDISQFSLMPDFEDAVLRLEVTNICNHHCSFCPHNQQMRKPQIMDHQLAIRLIEEAGQLGIKKLALFLNGEPFINPNLENYIKYAKDVGIPFVFVTSNGTADIERYYQAMENGLDSLKLSINGTSKETYQSVHGVDQYSSVMEKLKRIREYRDKHSVNCRILSGCVVTKHIYSTLENHYDAIKDLVDDMLFMNVDNFAGYMIDAYNENRLPIPRTLPSYDFPKKKLPCTLLFNSINITSEGYLTLCCSEALNYLVVDDINNSSIEEGWHSNKMKELRERHLLQKVDGTQCFACMTNRKIESQPLNQYLYDVSKIK